MSEPPSITRVTVGGTIAHPVTGELATGTVRAAIPVALDVPTDGYVLGPGRPAVFDIAAGVFVGDPPSLPATDDPDFSQQSWLYEWSIQTDVWTERFHAPLPTSLGPTTTLAAIHSLAVTDPPPPATVYVPLTSVGQPGGPGGPLREDGTMPPDQIPGTTKQYAAGAGPLDVSTLTDSGMTGTVTVPTDTVYEDMLFDVDSILIPNDHSGLRRCKVIANAVNGVRLDANTGLEVGRILEDCEIINPGGRAIAGAGFTATRVYGHHLGDDFAEIGRSHAEPTVLDSCKADAFRPLAAAHFDGVQVVTVPAAPVIIRDCDFNMAVDTGFTVPGDAGSTGAVFVAYDVAVNPDTDPDPDRVGKIYVLGSRLRSSTGNYTLAIAGEGVTVAECAIGAGTTGTENITAGHVSGWGNTDLDGNALTTDIHGSDLGDYLLVGDPRQESVGGATTFAGLSDVDMTGLQDGQVGKWDATAGKWKPFTLPTGGGGTGQAMSILSGKLTSGNVAAVNTGGDWLPIAGTSQPISAVLGDQVRAEFGFLTNAGAGTCYDIGVVVAGGVVRLLNAPSFPPDSGYEGMPETNPDVPVTFFGPSVDGWFDVTSGDLDGANVVFCIAWKSVGAGSLEMNPDIPVTFNLYNNHQ